MAGHPGILGLSPTGVTLLTETSYQAGPGEVTELLHAIRGGDRDAVDQLLPQVYDELRRLARYQMRDQKGHTLAATALVHEAYLKLAAHGGDEWQDRAHFFAVAARAMRQILVDSARRKAAEKRGGSLQHTTLGDAADRQDLSTEEVLALDEALSRLGELDERLARLIEVRFFAGLTEKEAATVLDVPKRTLQRDWARARAWLYKELYPEKT